jgi:hypothetical protein
LEVPLDFFGTQILEVCSLNALSIDFQLSQEHRLQEFYLVYPLGDVLDIYIIDSIAVNGVGSIIFRKLFLPVELHEDHILPNGTVRNLDVVVPFPVAKHALDERYTVTEVKVVVWPNHDDSAAAVLVVQPLVEHTLVLL